MKRPDISIDSVVHAYFDEHKTVNAISKEYNCSRGAICNRLAASGKSKSDIAITKHHNMALVVSGSRNPMYGKKHSVNTRKRLSEVHIGLMVGKKHPAYGKHRSNEYRRKISENLMGRFRGPESPHWRGGVSYLPYCHAFTEELKEQIREKFNRKCVVCGGLEKDNCNGRLKLICHHTDYNKMQGCGKRPWALVAVCHKCNSRANYNRWWWFSLLYNHWAMNPDINFSGLGIECHMAKNPSMGGEPFKVGQ